MKTTNVLLAVMLAGASLIATAVRALDWPQWQGPDRNAISKETGLLQEWPDGGPALAWKATGLGGGYSAPAIANGRIYGMSHRGEDEVVWALSEAGGKEIWVTRLGPAYRQAMPQGREGPGCTPTVDGDRVYVIGLGGTLACLRTSDGKVLWQKNLITDFGGVAPTWSYRESPLIDGNKLICTPGGNDALMVALDKMTGEVIWKNRMPETAESTSAEPRRSPAGFGGRRAGGGGDARGESGPAQRPPTGRTGPGARPAMPEIAGTKNPGLFLSEHWGMSAFSRKVPNGKYLVKLYFAETYRGITGPGQRVFSFKVQDREFKDFDIWKKAGGPNRAYIETVPVEVTNGELRIEFTAQVQSPAINAIEIIPQDSSLTAEEASRQAIRINAGQDEPFTDSRGLAWQPDQGFEGGGFGGPRMFARFAGAPPGGDEGGRERRRPGGFGGFGGRARSGAGYASAIVIEALGQRQYVQMTARALIGVAASDGKVLWRYDRPANRMGINCTTPLFHDGMVFAASDYGAGGGLAKLIRAGDGGVKAEEVWFTRNMENHHGGVVLVDGCLYGANGGNSGGYLVCLDFKTGEVLWNERDPDKRRARKGSIAVADGRIYYRTEDGTMLLIEPNRERYIERGRFEQPDRTRQPAWTHPVIANGKLYIRDQDTLFCYDVKAK